MIWFNFDLCTQLACGKCCSCYFPIFTILRKSWPRFYHFHMGEVRVRGISDMYRNIENNQRLAQKDIQKFGVCFYFRPGSKQMHSQSPSLIFFMKRDLFILVLSFREFRAKVVLSVNFLMFILMRGSIIFPPLKQSLVFLTFNLYFLT